MEYKIILLILCVSSSHPSRATRAKRFLIVPPTAPTRHQWIVGIGIPLDLENIAVTTGYVIKAQYFLPTKAEDLRPSLDAWPDLLDGNGIGGRGRTRREIIGEVLTDASGFNFTRYSVPAVVVEEKPNEAIENEIDSDFFDDDQVEEGEKDNQQAQSVWSAMQKEGEENGLGNSRGNAYKMIAGVAERNGLEGRGCVLRMICETATAPISHKSGILGEMIHILLTPSASKDPIDREYQRAEQLGASGGDCNKEFDCQRSLLDIFTEFQDPFNSFFSLLS